MQPGSQNQVLKLLRDLVAHPKIQSESFSAALRVPDTLRKVALARDELIQKYGPLVSVVMSQQGPLINFKKAQIPVDIALDGSGFIGGLYFKAPIYPSLSQGAVVDGFRNLPGRASVFIERDGKVWGDYLSSDRLAVGSAFKISVLWELIRDIHSGRRKWDEVVRSSRQTTSFGGIFDEWPAGTAFTLETLAIAMIVASDNSATDLLIDLVGRSRLETSSGNAPFLTTREMYLLKFGAARARAREFAAASVARQREILQEIGDLEIHGSPTGLEAIRDIEWFFSARELAQIIKEVRNASMFQVSGGPFHNEYKQVAFKAGREPGVLNYTAFLEHEGVSVVFSATWNHDGGVDEDEFSRLLKGGVGRCFGRA
jgi:hypothetical protein